ncbi:MAG: hypothetical protein ACRCXT_13330 [Paraclostridium sp.]
MEERVSNVHLSLDLFTTIIKKYKDCGIIHWGNNSRVKLPIKDYKILENKNGWLKLKRANYYEDITPFEIDYTFVFNDEHEYDEVVITLIGDNVEVDLTLFEKEYKVYEDTIFENTVIVKLYSNTFLYIRDTTYDEFLEFCSSYKSTEDKINFINESHEEIINNPLYINEGVFYHIYESNSQLFNIDYHELFNFTNQSIGTNSIVEIENEYVRIRLTNLKYAYDANRFSNHVSFVSGDNQLVIQYVHDNGPYHPNKNILILSVVEIKGMVTISINNDIKIYKKDAGKSTYKHICSYNKRREEELEYQREQDRAYYSSMSSEERESLDNWFEA